MERNKEKKKRNPVKVLVTIVLVIVGIFAGLFVFHRVKHSLDMKFWAKKGYYNPVSIGDYSMNVVKFGYEEIVQVSGSLRMNSRQWKPESTESADRWLISLYPEKRVIRL